MRCPECRKKIHMDDVYCIWCGAPLRKGIPTEGEFLSDTASAENRQSRSSSERPEKGTVLKRLLLFPVLPVLLITAVVNLTAPDSIFHRTEDAEPLPVPENAEILDIPLVQWEDFTLQAEYLTLDEETGSLTIQFLAENRSKHTVLCGDPLVSLDGYQIRSNMYLELPAKKSAAGYIYIDTDPLQTVDIYEIQNLMLEFCLYDAQDGSLLTREDSAPVPVNKALPLRHMESGSHLLLEDAELSVRLTGIAVDSDEARLYILMENQSDRETTLYLNNVCWENSTMRSSGYHVLPPGVCLLTSVKIYGIPAGTAGRICLNTITETEDARSHTILLSAEGSVLEVIPGSE